MTSSDRSTVSQPVNPLLPAYVNDIHIRDDVILRLHDITDLNVDVAARTLEGIDADIRECLAQIR